RIRPPCRHLLLRPSLDRTHAPQNGLRLRTIDQVAQAAGLPGDGEVAVGVFGPVIRSRSNTPGPNLSRFGLRVSLAHGLAGHHTEVSRRNGVLKLPDDAHWTAALVRYV